MNIVTVHNLKKYFGKGENQVKALDGIDLEIEKGKFTAMRFGNRLSYTRC